MLSGEAANTNFIVFGLARPGLEPTNYHTQGEHANHYTPNAVNINTCTCIRFYSILDFRELLSRVYSTEKVPQPRFKK